MSKTINIPTINDRLKDFDCLFQLLQQVSQGSSEVILDFSQCWFLEWAFQAGNSTRRGRVAGGVGLDYLKTWLFRT